MIVWLDCYCFDVVLLVGWGFFVCFFGCVIDVFLYWLVIVFGFFGMVIFV